MSEVPSTSEEVPTKVESQDNDNRKQDKGSTQSKRRWPKRRQSPVSGPRSSGPTQRTLLDSLTRVGQGRQIPSGIFCNDYRGYAQLVRAVYDAIRHQCSDLPDVIPRSLFNYYCYIALWRRLLNIVRSNCLLHGNLSIELDHMNGLGDMWLPAPISHYLQGLGNMVLPDGVNYRLGMHLTRDQIHSGNKNGLGGYFNSNDAKDLALYTLYPMPYVFSRMLQMEMAANSWSDAWISGIEAEDTSDTSYMTINISIDVLGYDPVDKMPTSIKDRLQGLGWDNTTAAHDAVGSWSNTSFETIRVARECLTAGSRMRGQVFTSQMFNEPIGSMAQSIIVSGGPSQWKEVWRSVPVTEIDGYGAIASSGFDKRIWQAGYVFAYRLALNGRKDKGRTDKTKFNGCGFIQLGPNDEVLRTLAGMAFWQMAYEKEANTDLFYESNFSTMEIERKEIILGAISNSFALSRNLVPRES